MTVRILAMRLSRAGMHFRLFMLALIVVVGRFPVVMRGRLVFGSRGLVVCAGRMFCGRSHQRISFEGTSMTFSGRSARLTSVVNHTDFPAAWRWRP